MNKKEVAGIVISMGGTIILCIVMVELNSIYSFGIAIGTMSLAIGMALAGSSKEEEK